MKNDYYKTVPINRSFGMTVGETCIKSTIYDDLESAFFSVCKSNYLKSVNWKNASSIKDKNTSGLFAQTGAKPYNSERMYINFIELFLAKFIFSNDLILNMDAISLFQVDFLGWTSDMLSE